jgi:tetratricopeptide (TPR) repeat protein
MINRLDKDWLSRYNEGTLEGKEDYIQLGDLFLSDGHYYRALEIYQKEVGEDIPIPKLVEAAECREQLGDEESSLRMYNEAVRRIDTEERELVKRIFKSLKLMKGKIGDRQVLEIEGLEQALLDKFGNSF